MKVPNVRSALKEFVSAEGPHVVALAGRWGRGKTHFWRDWVDSSASALLSVANRYSYVSVFGIGSLEALREEIFVNSVALGAPAKSDTWRQKLGTLGKKPADEALGILGADGAAAALKLAEYVKEIPGLKGLTPIARGAAFLSVSEYVVCVDDLERHSENLSIRDILGFVSSLRERKKCRVLVILNVDALSSDDLAEYHRLREKVFDYEIAFDPSAAECAELVFDSSAPHYERAREAAIQLGITNIRVMSRIRRVIDLYQPFVKALDARVLNQVVRSAVLLTWAYNTRDEGAPSFDYLRRFSFATLVRLADAKEKDPQAEAWNKILDEYGYSSTDDLDLEICKTLEGGYVDDSALEKVLSDRHNAALRAEAEEKFALPWSILRGGFGDDLDRIKEAFKEAFKVGARWITPVNVSGTTETLRQLGDDALADALLDVWIAVQSAHDPARLDLSDYPFRGEIRDPTVFEAIERAIIHVKFDPPFLDVLTRIADGSGWSTVDIRVLAAASEDEYVEGFHALDEGLAIRSAKECLRFGTIPSESAEYATIGSRVRAALIRIAGESPLNDRRVRNLGIDTKAAAVPEAAV